MEGTVLACHTLYEYLGVLVNENMRLGGISVNTSLGDIAHHVCLSGI